MKDKQKPFPLQLALQGGGAKICTLIAAAEAIQTLQDQGVLQVTRVAGTSAGAIVGCLLAAGIKMEQVREHLRQIPPKKFAKLFPQPSSIRIWWSLLMQKQPLWGTTFIQEQLQYFFNQKKVLTLGDLKKASGIETLIIAADLGESRKVVYKEADQHIIPALLASTGIPFGFRVWGKGDNPVLVDGGICENLPSDELEQHETEYGPVVGISFDPVGGKNPSNLKDFSKALLDTAINNSMNRARMRLGDERVFSIATRISTFDFEQAFADGFGDHYEIIKRDAEVWFRKFVDTRTRQTTTIPDTSKIWEAQNLSMMTSLGEVYERQCKVNKLNYLELSIIVKVNCLKDKDGHPERCPPDDVSYRIKFQTLTDSIYCHGIALSEADHATFINQTDFSIIRESDSQLIETLSIPIRNNADPSNRELLLFFLPSLPSESGPYILEVKDLVKDFMKPLRETGKDDIGIIPQRAKGLIGRIDLVLHLPKIFDQAKMVPKNGPSNGRLMTNSELLKYSPPFGFRAIGWTGTNLKPDTPFEADVYLR